MPRLEIVLLAVSVLALLAGLYFPIRILAEPPPSIMTYGLILFSLPAWLIGGFAAGIAGWRIRKHAGLTPLWRLAWALCAINLITIIAIFLWHPAGIS
jgi:hypothetical protein